MAGNSLLTTSMITKEALRVLKNQTPFSKKVNRQYDKRFAVSGAKIGDNITIRKPPRYQVTTGSALEIQDSAEQSVNLQLDTQKHVGMAFNSKDLTPSIDEFSDRFILPAVTALGADMDFTGYNGMYKKIYSAVGVPSATALPSTLKGFTQAKAKIAMLGGPQSPLTAIVDPNVEASLVEGLKGLFQSSSEIKKQYEEGVMGYAAGSEFRSSQSVAKHTIGQLGGATPQTNYPSTAYVAGATSLITDGWTASVANRLKKGDVIQIAGVYAVNPLTRQSTGELAQFVLTADADSDSSGNVTMSLDRGMYASGQLQNVDALPANNANITVFGSATAYASVIAPQNLVFHKDAFAMGCADLELPQGLDMAARATDEESGLSIRLIRDYDINSDRIVTRLDVLFGWVCMYPEFACRVVGQPA